MENKIIDNENVDSITLFEEEITDDEAEKFIQSYNELLSQDGSEEVVGEKNETFINKNLFKKTHQAKYLIKNADYYENLASNILFTYFPAHMWSAAFDKKDKILYTMNLICPENIPSFSLKGIKSYEDFLKLVLAAGKKILVEQDLERIISDEEFNEKLLKAKEVADKYKDN